VVLPASAETLFDMYLDPVVHAAITGNPVQIGRETGAEFLAFNGALSGTILATVRPKLIVQSWRSTSFKGDYPDSTLILSFSTEGDNGRIDLVHLDVPDHDYEGVTQGWEKYYWTPWRSNLAGRGKPRTTDLRPWLWGTALVGSSEHSSPRSRTERSVVRGKDWK
jgi:activator of HSP90 ATPase